LSVAVEHHPENGTSPWVVVLRMGESEFWFAYRTREAAEQKLPDYRAFDEELEAEAKP
jgi:hypothetical protein